LERDWKRVRPTARGQRFLNELLALFLSDGTRDHAPDGRGGGRVIRISSPDER
jgi:DNA-binding transcriptional LysR family regulator